MEFVQDFFQYFFNPQKAFYYGVAFRPTVEE